MEKIYFYNSLQQKLYGYLHRRSAEPGLGPTIILCHGMMSCKEGKKQTALAERLEKSGFSVLRFDFSFCGESEGVFEEITFTQEVDDLRSAVRWLRDNGGESIGLFGSSMGGGVAVLYASEDPAIKAMVTLAAVVYPRYLADRLDDLRRKMEQWKEDGDHFGAEGDVGDIFFEDAGKHNIPEAMSDCTVPVLIIHGESDEVVPVEEAFVLHEKASIPKALKIMPGCDHRFTKQEDLQEVLRSTQAWFEKYL